MASNFFATFARYCISIVDFHSFNLNPFISFDVICKVYFCSVRYHVIVAMWYADYMAWHHGVQLSSVHNSLKNIFSFVWALLRKREE